MNKDIIHSELYVQVVIAVSNRRCLIKPAWEGELYRQLSTFIESQGQKLLAINGSDDHVHLLLRLTPDCALEHLIDDIKKASNVYVNAGGFLKSYFSWQEGYGAFSYSKWNLESLNKSIRDQKLLHKRTSFRDEYIALLKENAVEFTEKDIFNWISEDRPVAKHTPHQLN